jgi:hypothetical protein
VAQLPEDKQEWVRHSLEEKAETVLVEARKSPDEVIKLVRLLEAKPFEVKTSKLALARAVAYLGKNDYHQFVVGLSDAEKFSHPEARLVREVLNDAISAARTEKDAGKLKSFIDSLPVDQRPGASKEMWDELLLILINNLVDQTYAYLKKGEEFKEHLHYVERAKSLDMVGPLVLACLTECLLRQENDHLRPPSGDDVNVVEAFLRRDDVATDPYVNFVRGLAVQVKPDWPEAVKTYEKAAFVRKGGQWLPWQNEERRRHAAKAYYEAGNKEIEEIAKNKVAEKAEKALQRYQMAKLLIPSDKTPIEYLPGYVEAAYEAEDFDEFRGKLKELLEDSELEKTSKVARVRIARHFVDWAETNRKSAEEMLEYSALQATLEAVPEPERNDALDFWMGKYFWRKRKKDKKDKKEALKWFASSLTKSEPVHLKKDQRRDKITDEIGALKDNDHWQDLFKLAIHPDPKNRTERQWELEAYRCHTIIDNLTWLKENLTQAKNVIEEANEMVSHNKKENRPYLECEGHAIAAAAIRLGTNNGFFPVGKKERLKEEDSHWEQLGTLLLDEPTFMEWSRTGWASNVVDELTRIRKETNESQKAESIRKMANTIKEYIDGHQDNPGSKPGLGDSKEQLKPIRV